MEANCVVIQRVSVFSFKNISDKLSNLTFGLADGENLVIEGRNALGKSNILNAIFWCLTGYDLNGCSDNEQFVPHGHESDGIVDVEVVTNVGKFQRFTRRDVKGVLSSSLVIDGLPVASLRDGEIEIDKRFGILPFTFSNLVNKDFNLRRFLLNPTYHFGLAPKTIRDVLAKQVSRHIKAELPFNQLFLELMKKYDLELTSSNAYESIECLSARIEADKKLLKSSLETLTTVQSYLSNIHDGVSPKVMDDLKFQIDEAKSSINALDSDLMVLDSGRQTLNEALENAQTGSVVVKFQTTTAKGIKKNDFKVQADGIDLKQCSTSETVLDSFALVDLWSKSVGFNVSLPIFVDRAESINSDRIESLSQNHQLLMTYVTHEPKLKINGKEVG